MSERDYDRKMDSGLLYLLVIVLTILAAEGIAHLLGVLGG